MALSILALISRTLVFSGPCGFLSYSFPVFVLFACSGEKESKKHIEVLSLKPSIDEALLTAS